MEQKNSLEERLRQQNHVIRMASLLLTLFCVAIFLAFWGLREGTKVSLAATTTNGCYITTTYNSTYTLGMVLSFPVMLFSLAIFICNLIYGKIDTVQAGESSVTLYRATRSAVLYVDGKKAAQGKRSLEAPLKNGSVLEVTLSRSRLRATLSLWDGTLIAKL